MSHPVKVICLSVCILLFVLDLTVPGLAEQNAIEQLIDIFEKKDLISQEEGRLLRRAVDQDREALIKKEKQIEARENQVAERERELEIREGRLRSAAEKKQKTPGPIPEGSFETAKRSGGGR